MEQVERFLGYTMIVLASLRLLVWLFWYIIYLSRSPSMENLVDFMFSELELKRFYRNDLFRKSRYSPSFNARLKWLIGYFVELLFPLELALVTLFIGVKVWLGFSWIIAIPVYIFYRGCLALGKEIQIRRELNAVKLFIKKYKIASFPTGGTFSILKVPEPYGDLYYLVEFNDDFHESCVKIYDLKEELVNHFLADGNSNFIWDQINSIVTRKEITPPELTVPGEEKIKRRLDLQRAVLGRAGLPL